MVFGIAVWLFIMEFSRKTFFIIMVWSVTTIYFLTIIVSLYFVAKFPF